MSDTEWGKEKASIKPIQKKNIVKTTLKPATTYNIERKEPDCQKHNYTTHTGNHDFKDFNEIDYKVRKKISKGLYPIDASIDLHGLTLEQAYNQLNIFINRSFIQQLRLTLVITGKGQNSNNNTTIKSSLLNWLNSDSIQPKIANISTAHQKHGGSGAFYVLLKKYKGE